MRRHNSEQFHKLRNIWKMSKDPISKDQHPVINSSIHQSSKDLTLRKRSNDLANQKKWNSPVPIKPVVQLFSHLAPQDSKKSLITAVSQLAVEKKSETYSMKGSMSSKTHQELHTFRVKHSETLRKKTANVFELKLISNWGDPDKIGLSQIELFNEKSEIIKLPSHYLTVKHSLQCSDPLMLLSGIKHSNDRKDMWESSLPLEMVHIKICMKVPVDYNVCGLKLWNYSIQGVEASKGVKEAELLLNHEKVWKGELKRGDFPTDIVLLVGFTFMDLENKVKMTLNSITRVVNAPAGEHKPKLNVFRRYKKSELKIGERQSLASLDAFFLESETAESRPLKIEDLVNEGPKEERQDKKAQVENHQEKFHEGKEVSENDQIKDQSKGLSVFSFFPKELKEKPQESHLHLFPPIGESERKSYEDYRISNGDAFSIASEQKFESYAAVSPSITADAILPEQETNAISNEAFSIPLHPRGQFLEILISSTWGDQYYVGLSGLEIFDSFGNPLIFPNPKLQISADPADINSLPGYGSDPRTVDKLLDGTNWTCDDQHLWLAPFLKGQANKIKLDFLQVIEISLIRIWNYNKSRIHSNRGAREVQILLDGSIIFQGEIQKAPGKIYDTDQYCEYILFTNDENVLQKIDNEDWVNNFERNPDLESELISTIILPDRPGTASKDVGEDGRPKTSADVPRIMKNTTSVVGRKIKVCIYSTWGDAYYVGMTGIQVVGLEGLIGIKKNWIDASPRDMNAIPGYSGDYRTIDKLVNNRNQTTDDYNMWLVPFFKGRAHYIEINLQEPMKIAGVKFWNYNKSPEDTFRGAKEVCIFIDGKKMTENPVVLRKAPGTSDFDFGQFFPLPCSEARATQQTCIFASSFKKQVYETPYLPTGFVLTLKLLNTWGDVHYIGLNGIEIFDSSGKDVVKKKIPCRVFAKPNSVRDLPNMGEDVRTPDKLIDGVNNTTEDRHMWLAPLQTAEAYFNLKGEHINEISIFFEEQISISYIRVWNYAKTPGRAVKEFMMMMDDSVVYKGFLRQKGPTAILFTGDPSIVKNAAEQVYYCQHSCEEVLMYNEGKLVGGLVQKKIIVDRPMTSVVK